MEKEQSENGTRCLCNNKKNLFQCLGRPAYLQINLDAIENNIQILRKCARNPQITIVGMVKGDGYGHGAVPVARHLKSIGVERLAVATVEEGVQLRKAAIQGPLHVFGNTQGWELESCLEYNILATLTTEEAILSLARLLQRRHNYDNEYQGYDNHQPGTVHIKIDTGMSRNGCTPEKLPHLVQLCKDHGVHVEGIFTHLANYEDKTFTEKQMNSYYKAIHPYRNLGLLFHVANSGGIITGVGTELDMIRPGIALYGLPPGEKVEEFEAMGFKPGASMHGQASLVKRLERGRKIGYGCTYTCEEDQWVATIPVGYADGYWRHLSNQGHVIRELTGEKCPLVGRVSMDAITVRVSEVSEPQVGESFTLITADFDPSTSSTGIAQTLGTIPYEVTTRFQGRLPKYYTSSSTHMKPFMQSLTVSNMSIS